MLKSLERLFIEAEQSPHNPSIQRWKEEGKMIIGWLCTYTPEEIIHAAGMLPIRVFGNPQKSSLGDAFLQPNSCPYARSCIGSAIGEEYRHLSGLVAIHTCDVICRLYDLWRIYSPPSFYYILDNPHKLSSLGHSYYREQLRGFIAALEEFAGIRLDQKRLYRTNSIYQQNRSLLKSLYRLRLANRLNLTASQVWKIIKASTVMPKEEHNLLLQEVLAELEGKGSSRHSKARLVISGSIMGDNGLLELLEECGVEIVADDLCIGTRYFWGEAASGGDPLETMVQFYLQKVPCACIHPPEPRLQHVIKMVKEFAAQGVILYNLIFCDTFAYDQVYFKKRLEELHIPVLTLTLEQPLQARGQVRTRIEAFLEMLG